MTSKAYDVVVIGGGAVGASCGYFLSKTGMKVAIVEQAMFANGTSSKCEGNLWVSDPAPGYFSRMANYAVKIYQNEVIPDLDIDVDFKNNGSILIAEDEEEAEGLKEFVKIKQDEGVDAVYMDKQELLSEEPYIARDVAGGALFNCDCKLSPLLLCNAYAQTARRYGADLYTYARVIDIVLDNNSTGGKVVTEKGTLAAENIVIACGVWTPDVAKMAGLDVPIFPRQGQCLVTEETPIVISERSYGEAGYVSARNGLKRDRVRKEIADNGIAFVLERSSVGNYVIGGSRRDVGYDITADRKVMKLIAERAVRFVPAMRDINVIRAYCGCRPVTADGMPIVSGTSVPGVYIAAGHGGNGINVSSFAGKAMQAIITNTEFDFDLEPLNFKRFEAR